MFTEMTGILKDATEKGNSRRPAMTRPKQDCETES